MSTSSPETVAPVRSRWPIVAALFVGVVCLSFAAFTGHMWEDYLITFRASLNLATGHGLVFQPGQRVHSFTSPLGTLLPALFALGGGDQVEFRALWLFRIASAFFLGGAVFLAARLMLRTQVAAFAIGAGCLAVALDPKIVDFSINGMECAILVFFIILAWRAFAQGPRVLPCAVAFAGLQWTRPDGCVFFGAIAGGWLMGRIADCGDRKPDSSKHGGAETIGSQVSELSGFRSPVSAILRGVLLGLLFYLPWLAFAWWYYGTPVPHTILAKISIWGPGELSHALLLYPWRLIFGHVALHKIFMPAYFFFGGWPATLDWFSKIIVIGAAVAWLVPKVRPAGRIASAAFLLGGFYVEYIPRSPWYYPGWQALALVAWVYLIDVAVRPHGASRTWLPAIGRIGAGVIVAGQAVVLAAVAWQLRAQQAIIETGNRTEIGRWLHAHAQAGDRVYLEPLGYIGYYSGLKMYDYPGLSSPEVVAARRAGKKPHAEIIAALQPDWLVLRPDEVAEIMGQIPSLLKSDYRLVRVYDAREKVAAVAILPGRPYLEFDAVFLVYHRGPIPPKT
ncbi:MAG: hypothetical protein JWM32_133 [Verrucomicrobia bacterium]|nr:hypothetical protein [Verrucomicrobiota bacterium]